MRRKMLDKLQATAGADATWPAISRCRACRRRLVFDRDTASRLGITPSTIDQTLYDAYGQREVSTMFTQLNQYHVVLEVKPDFQQTPVDLRDLYIRTGAGASGGGSGWSPAALGTARPRAGQPVPRSRVASAA